MTELSREDRKLKKVLALFAKKEEQDKKKQEKKRQQVNHHVTQMIKISSV